MFQTPLAYETKTIYLVEPRQTLRDLASQIHDPKYALDVKWQANSLALLNGFVGVTSSIEGWTLTSNAGYQPLDIDRELRNADVSQDVKQLIIPATWLIPDTYLYNQYHTALNDQNSVSPIKESTYAPEITTQDFVNTTEQSIVYTLPNSIVQPLETTGAAISNTIYNVTSTVETAAGNTPQTLTEAEKATKAKKVLLGISGVILAIKLLG